MSDNPMHLLSNGIQELTPELKEFLNFTRPKKKGRKEIESGFNCTDNFSLRGRKSSLAIFLRFPFYPQWD
jgi:hypothetical protein